MRRTPPQLSRKRRETGYGRRCIGCGADPTGTRGHLLGLAGDTMTAQPSPLFTVADRCVLVQGGRAYTGIVAWVADYDDGQGIVVFVKWDDGFHDETPWPVAELLLVSKRA